MWQYPYAGWVMWSPPPPPPPPTVQHNSSTCTYFFHDLWLQHLPVESLCFPKLPTLLVLDGIMVETKTFWLLQDQERLHSLQNNTHTATKRLVPKTLQDYNLAMGWDWQYFFEGKRGRNFLSHLSQNCRIFVPVCTYLSLPGGSALPARGSWERVALRALLVQSCKPHAYPALLNYGLDTTAFTITISS